MKTGNVPTIDLRDRVFELLAENERLRARLSLAERSIQEFEADRNDTIEKFAKVEAEIERLRAENEHFKLVDYYNGRDAAIEECARDVVDQMINECILSDEQRAILEQCAAAIRALKIGEGGHA